MHSCILTTLYGVFPSLTP
uniref:Uncharacterized protein n=1 Tax=Arundo donax TaxID=35708 RepID=A0A0A8Z0M9_ARUDO